MDKNGLLLCAKYAASPNFFGYCGPSKSSNLIDHLREGVADDELQYLLSEFETLYPYLQLIARRNKINDVFDEKVVEAYWIGNEFLNKVRASDYFYFAKERLILEKKLPVIEFNKVKRKIYSFQFLPHHSFHVFNIFKRTGANPSIHTVKTMNECRISFGKLKTQNSKLKTIIVETKQLTIINNKLILGKPILRQLKIDYKGKTFLNNLKMRDWVSFHWGYICDVLTERQVKNLEYYTQKAIDFYNL